MCVIGAASISIAAECNTQDSICAAALRLMCVCARSSSHVRSDTARDTFARIC